MVGVKFLPEATINYGDNLISGNSFKPALSGGVQLIKKFEKSRIGFETGIFYKNKETKLTIYSYDPFGSLVGSERISLRYYYLSVPLLVRLNLKNWYINTGVIGIFFES